MEFLAQFSIQTERNWIDYQLHFSYQVIREFNLRFFLYIFFPVAPKQIVLFNSNVFLIITFFQRVEAPLIPWIWRIPFLILRVFQHKARYLKTGKSGKSGNLFSTLQCVFPRTDWCIVNTCRYLFLKSFMNKMQFILFWRILNWFQQMPKALLN